MSRPAAPLLRVLLRVLPLVLGAAACAADLRDRVPMDDGPPAAGAGEDLDPVGRLDTGVDLREPVELQLDATSESDWIFVDLERQGLVTADLPWDLKLRRFVIALNGGVSGDGGVEAAPVEGVAFDALTEAPAGGWRTDAPDADGDGAPEYALGDWYAYDSATHVLAPREVIYVIRSVEGLDLKLQVLAYSDAAGTSGVFTLRVAALP